MLIVLLGMAAAGFVLGYLLSKYMKKLIEESFKKEGKDSPIASKKFAIIFSIVCAVISALSGYVFHDNILKLAIASLSCIVLLGIAAIDLHHSVIFDRFQLVFAVLSLANLIYECISKTGFNLASHLYGCLAGLVLFGGVAFIGSKIYKKEVMGLGDIELVTIAGLFLGWQCFLFSMLVATVVGSIVLLAIRKKGEEGKEYPFAPFLTLGIIAGILYGSPIVEAYLSLFNL